MTLFELLGATSEDEAVKNLLNERAAMVELKSDIDTLRIVKRRLVLVVEMSRRACLLLQSSGMMFLEKKIQDLIVKILDQCKALEKYIDFAKELK